MAGHASGLDNVSSSTIGKHGLKSTSALMKTNQKVRISGQLTNKQSQIIESLKNCQSGVHADLHLLPKSFFTSGSDAK